MKDLNTFDFTVIKTFINTSFQKGVELGAFNDTGFSIDSFIDRVMMNGFEETFDYRKAQSNKFERISYSTAYRRKSSSGQIAKTSIVFYRFSVLFNTNEMGAKTIRNGTFMEICWPIHLMNKKTIHFDLETGEIWLSYRHADFLDDVHRKVSLEGLIKLVYMETMGSIYFIVNKKTNIGMNKKAFFELPSSTIRAHMSLCDMIEV